MLDQRGTREISVSWLTHIDVYRRGREDYAFRRICAPDLSSFVVKAYVCVCVCGFRYGEVRLNDEDQYAKRSFLLGA